MTLNYIKRDMEDLIIELNEQYPAILVTGSKQVGKTTMLKKVMEIQPKIMRVYNEVYEYAKSYKFLEIENNNIKKK